MPPARRAAAAPAPAMMQLGLGGGGRGAFEGDEAMDNLRAHPQWQ